VDVVSHGLWGSALLGRGSRRRYAAAFGVSLLPDVFGEGVMFALVLLGLPGMPDLSHGHPDITQFPAYAQNFYNATHSLIVFGAVFLAVWLLRRKAPLLLLAWGLHVLIDIPTHSLQLFPTPFLWPISAVRVDGIGWRSPAILVPDILLLLVVYGVWAVRRSAASRAVQRQQG
jgi:hypothetical protein